MSKKKKPEVKAVREMMEKNANPPTRSRPADRVIYVRGIESTSSVHVTTSNGTPPKGHQESETQRLLSGSDGTGPDKTTYLIGVPGFILLIVVPLTTCMTLLVLRLWGAI